jgi:transposase
MGQNWLRFLTLLLNLIKIKIMQKNYLGIDVSKLTFDVSLIIVHNGDKQLMVTTKFNNDATGLASFKLWLEAHQVSFDANSLLVMENTGIYHRLIWNFCTTHVLPVFIGNAADLKWSFGITRGKSDKVDSMRLCDYAYKNQEDIKPTTGFNKALITLKDLLSNRSKLMKQKNAIKQTLKELKISNDKTTQQLIEKLNKAAIEGLQKSIKLIEAELLRMVKQDASIGVNYYLMLSVPGVGKITAVFIICCTNNFAIKVTGKQLANYAGVVPFENTSGTSVKGRSRIHFMANKELKSLLTMGALSAIQAYPEFKDYYDRKMKEGKKHLQVLNAVKNKMLLRVTAVINQQKYYENKYKTAC